MSVIIVKLERDIHWQEEVNTGLQYQRNLISGWMLLGKGRMR